MAALWFLYLIVLWFLFNEPSRVGLEELKQRELSTDLENDDRSGKIDGCFSIDFEDVDDVSPQNTKQSIGFLNYINRGVRTAMTLMFVKRIALECAMGSTSMLTKNRYGWNVKSVGLLQCINGLLVIPLSILAGYSSQYYEEVAKRKNVLLLGDSLADLGMSEGIPHEEIVQIGFLNFNERELLAEYKEKFDLVITQDGGMDQINNILEQILTESSHN